MAAISSVFGDYQPPKTHHHHQHGAVAEEIEGLIRVFKDGCVDRPLLVPIVPPTTSNTATVKAKDIILPNHTWTRVYVPVNHTTFLPLLVYFHGGGFCVGSAAWQCYHEFLATLAVKARCVIVSVNYRLAPENRLPAAYDDGINLISWMKQQALDHNYSNQWWLSRCNLSSLFLAGDSAGANIAYNVALRLTTTTNTTTSAKSVNPLTLKGLILIQPFIGGESRTASEKNHSAVRENYKSALTLPDSDTYWRLALPLGATRDHPMCNPLLVGTTHPKVPRTMVCVSEMDILKDRNLELVKALRNSGNKVEAVVYGGVGHAFQILYNSPKSHVRVQEMFSHMQNFINSS